MNSRKSDFQKRHYEQIARLIWGILPENDEEKHYGKPVISRDLLVDDLCRLFGNDNPNFNPDRFRCAVNGEKYKRPKKPRPANIEVRQVRQNHLTSECWMVQFRGLDACEDCEYRDTEECGGVEIRKTRKNEKGFEVPV